MAHGQFLHMLEKTRFRGRLQIPTNLAVGSPLAYESTAVMHVPVSFGMAEKGRLGIAQVEKKPLLLHFKEDTKTTQMRHLH